MRIFLLAVLSFSLTGLFAQTNRCSIKTPHQADNWLFHQHVGIKFNDVGVSLNNPLVENLFDGKGTAAISNDNGDLLFYTDGITIWNNTHQRINGNDLLRGSNHSTQSSLIVPCPGSNSDYFIFTTDQASYPGYSTKGLNYSMVKISQNGAQVEITDKWNLNLLPECTEMLSGVKHANGVDYWVVTHGVNGNSFHAFLVDSSGVNQNQTYVSNVGAEINGNLISRETIGAMKLSPKGDKIAYASFGKKMIQVLSFNNSTGEIGYLFDVDFEPDLDPVGNYGPYYVEFSPDGTKLYYTINYLSDTDNHLYQLDLLTNGPPILLNDPALGFLPDVTALQLARDGKIYVARLQKNLGVIENPNRAGTSSNYKQDGLNLGLKKSQRGLTNFIQSYFDIPPIDFETKCEDNVTQFTLLNESNIDVASWDFGDPLDVNTVYGLNPVHIYSEPGTYYVTLTETFGGEPPYTTTIPVLINPLPPKSFEAKDDTMYLFPGSKIPLDAGQGMFSYTWQDGSNNQYFDVDSPGLVVVEYEDINCCRNSDKLEVISLDISLPSAFTPDGNGINDYFKALGPSEGIEDFTLILYNRWGQRIWETNNFDEKWDGTLNGQKLPSGVYAWYIAFNVIGNSLTGKVKYKGSVTLIR